MRGPDDEAGVAAAPNRSETPTEESAEPPRKPPGGKALTRLMQLLESAGLTENAEAAVEAAVGPEQDDEYRQRSQQLTASPIGLATAPKRSSPRNTEKDTPPSAEQGEVGVATAAANHMSAALRGRPSRPPSQPQWRSLGPWTILNGQTYGASRVNVSGRVAAIAVDPSDSAHVLCGAANGGVWESHDHGASWAPRTDFAATLAIGAIAFDPSNARSVYCGTGEGNWWWFLGAGVLHSTDGGTSWTQICATPFVGVGFYDLIVDPTNGSHLLAATTAGLFVSTDGGLNWTPRRFQRTWSLATAPVGGAGAEILAASIDGVVRSIDGGTTWVAVILPGAPASWDRIAVAIAPTNPTVAYAWGASEGVAHLYRRADGNWTTVAPPPGVAVGQAWYDWFLAISPDSDTQIYCGAVDVHRGDLAGATWSWLNITSKGVGEDSIHPDSHAIAFEPGGGDTIYVGSDGGLFRSTNRGVNWQHCNNGLVISEFEYIAQSVGTSPYILGGTQDNGTDRWTGTPAWDHVADGDGGDCAVSQEDPNIVFHTFYDDVSKNAQAGPERSASSGDFGSWQRAGPARQGEGALFYPPMECSASDGTTIAFGTDALYVSRDYGGAWTRLTFPTPSPPFTIPSRSSTLYIPTANAVYVGATNGGLFVTTWNGANWATLTALTTPRANAYVSDLFVDPANPNRIWVTHRTINGGRLFRSDDGGGSWVDRTAGLPLLPINAVEVDNQNANRLWVAADRGVYQSMDAGATWNSFSNGLPNMYVGDLLFHSQLRLLRAATRNRGVWEVPVDG